MSRVGRRAVVLGAPDDVLAVAAAVANEVRGRAGAVVGVWSPQDTAGNLDAPATPGARRLAALVHNADAPAAARGRIAWTMLPRDPATAAGHVVRLAALPAPAPGRPRVTPGRPTPSRDAVGTVLAVAGPRPAEFDAALAASDLVVLVVRPSDGVLADVARRSVAGLSAATVTVPPLHGAAKVLALAGMGRLAQARVAPVGNGDA